MLSGSDNRAHLSGQWAHCAQLDALLQQQLGRAAAGLGDLTPRELELLELLASGWSNASIAARLRIRARTVQAHVRNVFLKLGLPDEPAVNRRVLAARVAAESQAAGSTPV